MLDNCDYNLKQNWQLFIQKKHANLKEIIAKIESLSPMKTLHRGYSISTNNNKAISSIKDVSKQDQIDITVKDGLIKAEVIAIIKNNEENCE